MPTFFKSNELAQLIMSIGQKWIYAQNELKDSEFKKGILHIEVEKYLNRLYPFDAVKNEAFHICFLSKEAPGFGDVVWTVRAVEALKSCMLNAKFTIVSDGIDKFKKFIFSTSDIELVPVKIKGMQLIGITDNVQAQHVNHCDLIIDGPYGPGVLTKVFEPATIERLQKQKCYLKAYEYDVARYFAWGDHVNENLEASTFLSGIADYSFGIFIIEELKQFALNPETLSITAKQALIQQLSYEALRETISSLDIKGNCPIYFGYSQGMAKNFLEIVMRIEAENSAKEDVIVVLCGDHINDNTFFEMDLSRISLIETICDRTPFTENELEEFPKRFPVTKSELEKTNHELRNRMQPGKTYAIDRNIIFHSDNKGKKIHVIQPSNGLNPADMMLMYKITQSLTLVTGDQSLTEAISGLKHILYDPRKVDTLEWLIKIAKREKLPLVEELLSICNGYQNIKRIVEILKHPEFPKQNQALYLSCHQHNLAKSLQQMFSRRIISRQKLSMNILENKIHTLVEALFFKQDNTAMKDLLKTSKALIKEIHDVECEIFQKRTVREMIQTNMAMKCD